MEQVIEDAEKLTLEERIVFCDGEISLDGTDLETDYSALPHFPIWSTEFDNVLLSNTSSKIKLQYNEAAGRQCVATADIKTGRPSHFFLIEYRNF